MADINQIVSQEAIKGIQQTTAAMAALYEATMKAGKAYESNLSAISKSSASASEKAKMLSDAEKEQAKTLSELDKQRQKAYGQLAKQEAKEKEYADLISKQAKTLEELTKQNKALIVERNKVDTTTEKGRKQLIEYNTKINQNTEAIRKSSSAHEQQRMNIGNYQSALDGAKNMLLKLTGVLGITIGAGELFNKILGSTRGTLNAVKDMAGGAKEAFGFLARSIATVDFSNLIQGFRDAYDEGVRYAQSLRDIAAMQRALGITKADIEGQILEQKIIARNRRNDIADRQAAVEEIIRLEELKLTETKKVTEETLANELKNTKVITGLNDEQIIGLVRNEDAYKDAAKAGKELNQQITANIAVTMQQIAALRGNAMATGDVGLEADLWKNALKDLTPLQREQIALYEGSNLLLKEQRDKIAAAMVADITAVNEQKSGILSLSRLRNQLYNELIKEENELEKVREEASENEMQADRDSLNIKKMTTIETGLLEEKKTQITLDGITIRTEAEEAAHQRTLQRIEEERQKRIDSAMDYTGQIASIGETMLSFSQFILDQESQKIEQRYRFEMQLAGENEMAKEAAQKRYDKERSKLATKQAKQDKTAAIFRAIIGTAQAVIQGLAFGPPLGYVFAALNAVLGAVQIALIASQPIPQYAKGTRAARKGLAYVGERGRELIVGPDGTAQLTPSTATLVNLGRGGQRIIPNAETELLLRAAKGADDYTARAMLYEIKSGNDRLVRTIKDKRELHISTNGTKITERQGSYFRNYLNKKVKL